MDRTNNKSEKRNEVPFHLALADMFHFSAPFVARELQEAWHNTTQPAQECAYQACGFALKHDPESDAKYCA
jgi:hypothetical protein